MSPVKEKILILGGGGFIGSHLSKALVDRYTVRVFDRKNFAKTDLNGFIDKLEIFEGDINEVEDLKKSLEGMDYVFHLAWSTIPSSSNNNAVSDVETNILPFLKLLEVLRTQNVKKLIYLSSGGTVYGNTANSPIKESENNNPISSYGITKLAIEKYLFLHHVLHGLQYHVVRLSNPYGPLQKWSTKQGLITTLMYNVMNNIPIEIWGDGGVVRDYIYIDDVIVSLEKMLHYSGKELVFNISSGEGYSVKEILEKVISQAKKQPEIVFKANRSFDVKSNILDNTLAKYELNWNPEVQIDQGIFRVYQWMKDRI